MAKDIKLQYDNDIGEYDIVLGNGDLLREEGLETAILISLFTDRRAEKDDPLKNTGEYKGWWGDQLNEDNDKIGSRLWLLDGKTTQQNIKLAENYIREALQWLLDDGVAVKIDIEIERQGIVGNDILSCGIKIYYKDGTTEAFKFYDLWDKQVA